MTRGMPERNQYSLRHISCEEETLTVVGLTTFSRHDQHVTRSEDDGYGRVVS